MKKIIIIIRKLAWKATKKIYFGILSLFYTQKKFLVYEQNFLLLPGCKDASLKEQYLRGNLEKIHKPIRHYYEELYKIISEKIKNKEPYTILRASDGEALFLQKKPKGNILIRHYTKDINLNLVDMEQFKDALLQCDLKLVEMYRNNQKAFRKIYRSNVFSEIPFECAYALMASKKILKTDWKIGIIGADNKIEIIKRLLQFSEYRNYIGREKFEDYITVPERGSANNPSALAESIKSKLRDDIDIYLVGIGIAKLVVLPKLKENSHAVFFDAGAGISALAGLVSPERPYFTEWINFRLRNFNYSRVDVMDAPMDEKIVYL